MEKEFVFATAHGGDVGEAVIGVREVGVGVWGFEAAGEDVQDRHGVAGGQPTND